MPALTVDQLNDGALVFRSELWATNSVLVPAGDVCLVCDPSIFPDEIADIRAATCRYRRIYVLVTHSDFDHVCGMPAFGDAIVVASATTAGAIADGTARRKLDQAEREWGASWEGALRVELVAGSALVRCDTCAVATIEACGHIDDGAAFVVVDRGLLLPGDYLSAVCHPIVLGSLQAALATHERLLRALDDHAITTVVPGHGPVLDRGQAARIGREDAHYLRALQDAAADAVRRGEGADAAIAMVRSVPPPRRARPDFDALDLPSSNACAALADAGHPAFR
jgi:glyoxylase-like metal-dependent hydrolase (beta-lactamase superfamily II)